MASAQSCCLEIPERHAAFKKNNFVAFYIITLFELLLWSRRGRKDTSGLTTLLLVLLVFFRWLWSSLVAPSWKVLGKAPSSMVNSGVLSSNKEMSTT